MSGPIKFLTSGNFETANCQIEVNQFPGRPSYVCSLSSHTRSYMILSNLSHIRMRFVNSPLVNEFFPGEMKLETS